MKHARFLTVLLLTMLLAASAAWAQRDEPPRGQGRPSEPGMNQAADVADEAADDALNQADDAANHAPHGPRNGEGADNDQRPGPADRDPAEQAGSGAQAQDADPLTQMEREEDKHRDRMARLARIREIMVERGNDEAVVAVDGVMERELLRHERVLARLARRDAAAAERFEARMARVDARGHGRSGDDEADEDDDRRGPPSDRGQGRGGDDEDDLDDDDDDHEQHDDIDDDHDDDDDDDHDDHDDDAGEHNDED